MKDREDEKSVDIFAAKYEEMTDDGRVYYDISSLDELNITLMCESKKGVIITGQKGSGKTTVMRRFVQQNLNEALGMDSVKVINIFEEFILECKNGGEVVQKLVELCKNYANNSVILFFKASNEEQLKTGINVFENYANRIKAKCGNLCLKLVIEYNIEDKKESDSFRAIDINSFHRLQVDYPDTLTAKMKIYNTMAAELSKIYNVKITQKMLLFTVMSIWGYVSKKVNLKSFYYYLESVFAYARKENQKYISKNLVKKVFKSAFDELLKNGEKQVRITAYHESGHALFCLLNSNFQKLEIVTVIPGIGYIGRTTYSISDESKKTIRSRQEVIDEIAGAIAGREAERLLVFPYTPNKGAKNDLGSAQELANELIYEFGISDSLGENYVVNKPEELSETMKYRIEQEKKKILEEATKRAAEEVFKHKDFIEKLGNKVVTNLLVTGDEARKMWKEHLEELEKHHQKSKLNNKGQ